jgi:tetratricopeptide (TPR) repeat protein
MGDRARRRAVWLALTVPLLIGLSAWLLWPRPSLEGVDWLLANDRYEEAEQKLLAYLRVYPGGSAVRVMLARASVNRPDPKPGLALELIQGVQPPDPPSAALLKAIEGEARFLQRRYDAAESAWLEALRLKPKSSEVGWGLLNLYAIQGRDDDTRRLGLQLFENETKPHDRVQLLLQLIRHDAHAIAPDSIVDQLEPVVRGNPGDLRSTLALGLALVHDSRFDAGLDVLRRAVESHRDSLEAWAAYISAMGDASRVEALEQTLAELLASLSDDSRFDVARGWVAAQRGDWAQATQAYRRAWEARPGDASLAYRLQTALRNTGQANELKALEPRFRAVAESRDKIRLLYDQIDALPDLGQVAHPVLFRAVADALEPLGRAAEVKAWRSLAEGSGPG